MLNQQNHFLNEIWQMYILFFLFPPIWSFPERYFRKLEFYSEIILIFTIVSGDLIHHQSWPPLLDSRFQ